MTLSERIAQQKETMARRERIKKIIRAYKCAYCGNTHQWKVQG